jgi:hypothetical protein
MGGYTAAGTAEAALFEDMVFDGTAETGAADTGTDGGSGSAAEDAGDSEGREDSAADDAPESPVTAVGFDSHEDAKSISASTIKPIVVTFRDFVLFRILLSSFRFIFSY